MKVMKKIVIIALGVFMFSNVIGQCLPVADNMILLDNWDNDNLYPSSQPSSHYSDCWGYAAGGKEYGIIGGRDSIFIIDVTDPKDIFRVAGIYQGDTSSWRDFKVFGDYLYSIVDGVGGSRSADQGVAIYDLSALPTVTKVKELNNEFPHCHNIFIDVAKARLYAAGFSGSQNDASRDDVCIYDLSTNPADPTLLGCYNLDLIATSGPDKFYFHDLFARDNIVYGSHGDTGYFIWDMNDLSSITLLGSLDNSFFGSSYVHSSWNSDDNNYAVVATEVRNSPQLYWVDQSNPALMSIEDTFRDPLCVDAGNLSRKRPHNPFIIGDTLYVSHYEDGVQILEIDNVNNTVDRIGYYDTYIDNSDYFPGFNGNWGIYPFLPSGTIIASDLKYGLYTLKYKTLDTYVFKGPTTAWATPSNWEGGVVPPDGFTGIVQINANCIKNSDSDLVSEARIQVRTGVIFTQQ